MNRKQEKKQNQTSVILSVIKEHILQNKREYLIVAVLFLIGLTVGMIFVNRMTEVQASQIAEYLNNFIVALKTDYRIDQAQLLKSAIVNDSILAVILWLMGCTVIGVPIVYAIVAIRGFSLGYTISAILATFGTGKGIVISLLTLFLQNIIAIPAILALAVSRHEIISIYYERQAKRKYKNRNL